MVCKYQKTDQGPWATVPQLSLPLHWVTKLKFEIIAQWLPMCGILSILLITLCEPIKSMVDYNIIATSIVQLDVTWSENCQLYIVNLRTDSVKYLMTFGKDIRPCFWSTFPSVLQK